MSLKFVVALTNFTESCPLTMQTSWMLVTIVTAYRLPCQQNTALSFWACPISRAELHGDMFGLHTANVVLEMAYLEAQAVLGQLMAALGV